MRPAGLYTRTDGAVAGGLLAPTQAAQPGTLTFLDPEGLTFTYDLVFLGRLNHPPRFTSVPVVTVFAGQVYRYQATGFDPDGDPLGFAVAAGPTALGFPNSHTGMAVWATMANDAGTYPIHLQVRDGFGGTGDQYFVLSILNPHLVGPAPRMDWARPELLPHVPRPFDTAAPGNDSSRSDSRPATGGYTPHAD